MKVTLFPFLSVLLCMMGAMIMLLVIVARNVQEQTNFPPAAPPAQPVVSAGEAGEIREQIRTKTEEAEWFAEQLRIVQKRAEDELADWQAKLAVAEKETEAVKAEIRRLEKLAGELENPAAADPAETERLKELLARQKQRLQQTELELAELQKAAANRKKSYAIVPHKREDGTFRRPVYIECKENKIIIQPEGVELVPGDFAAADRPDNPFDTVLRVVRQYYLETNQSVRGSEPYPLMVIRPSGVEMYENARHALGNWVKDFGYEIVNEDWYIEYPPANDELRNRIVQQLDVARSRLSGFLIASRMAEQGGRADGSGVPRFRVDHRGNVIPLPGHSVPAGGAVRGSQGEETGNRGNDAENSGVRQPAAAAEQPPRNDTPFSPSSLPSPLQETAEQNIPNNTLPDIPPNVPKHTPPAAAKRPENWALKNVSRLSSEISRVVKIRCEADRFILAAQTGLNREKVILIGNSVQTAVDELVLAIWEFQDSWGVAGENMHWKPVLRVQVRPGGEQRFQELQMLLKQSGMTVENM